MLAPRDITNKQFGKSTFGGYKQEDVNSFLMEIAEEYSRALSERNEMERQLSRALEELGRYQQEQESLSTVLVGAQKMADTIIRDAKGQSEIIQRDAEIRADKMLEGTKRQLEMERQEYSRLKTEVSDFRSTVLNLYKSHLELVNALPSGENISSIPSASTVVNDNERNSSVNNLQNSQESFERMEEPTPDPQSTGEQSIERNETRRRKGFVPNLNYTSTDPVAGFSFQQQSFEEVEGQGNEIENDNSGMVSQLSDPLIQADETNIMEEEIQPMNEEYGTAEQDASGSKFGQLQFGQNYRLNREDERRMEKKKKRR